MRRLKKTMMKEEIDPSPSSCFQTEPPFVRLRLLRGPFPCDRQPLAIVVAAQPLAEQLSLVDQTGRIAQVVVDKLCTAVVP